MTKHIIYLLLIVLVSCDKQTPAEEVDFSTTEEIQYQKNVLRSSKTKRDRDIVKHLYEEALEQDPTLKSLENRMSTINGTIQDSLEAYTEYVQYNKLYYQSAQRYIQSIKDSTKRQTLSAYFSDSNKRLEAQIAEHKNLGSISEALERELLDQQVIMKLIVAEKLIRAYQDETPDTAPIRSVNETLRGLINESEQYTNTKEE